MSYGSALESIYETIGCTTIRKPKLSYRMSTAPARSDPIGLESEEDWAGCLEDVDREQGKRGSSVPVNLLIDPVVSHPV